MLMFNRPLLILILVFSLLILEDRSRAQIVRDGTVGPAVGSVVEPRGPNYQIDSTLGRIKGKNLFHSFSDFNVQTSPNGTVESATFTNSLPISIENILSRVTGGKASTINGKLASTIDNANLFLLNPNGVMFGPNASLDLKGSFHVSTADVLRFDNGAAFYMDASLDGSMDSVIKMPALPAFGFLDGPSTFGFTKNVPAGITIDQAVLSVEGSKTVSVIGGDVTLRGGEVRAGANGQITFVGMDSPGEFNPTQGSIEVTNLNGRGTINIAEGTTVAGDTIQVLAQGDIEIGLDSQLNASGTQGGLIHIESQSGTTMASGRIEAKGATEQGGTVHVLGDRVGLIDRASVDVSGELGGGTALIGGDYKGEGTVKNAAKTYVGPKAIIRADANTTGEGGRVIVWADEATQFEGSILARGGDAGGNGGFAEVSGKQSLTYQGQTDLGAVNGKVGTLLLDPTNWVIADGGPDDLTGNNDTSTIDADVLTAALEISNVDLQATNSIIINETVESKPNPKNLTLRADGSITVNQPIIIPGGTIELNGGSVLITGEGIARDGKIDVSGERSGQIAVKGTNVVLNDASIVNSTSGANAGGTITLTANSLTLTNSRIESDTIGPNDAGNILVQVKDSLKLLESSHISTSVNSTRSINEQRSAGSIIIQGTTGEESRVGEVIILNSEGISSSAVAAGSKAAGNIKISAKKFILSNLFPSREGVRSDGGGSSGAAGGTIDLNVSESIMISGSAQIAILVQGENPATTTAGNIIVTTPSLTINDQARISAASAGTRPAGNITVNVDKLIMTSANPSRDPVSIDSGNTGGGNGGKVTIRGQAGGEAAVALLSLDGARISTGMNGLLIVPESGIDGTGTQGGTIEIVAKDVNLMNEANIGTENFGGTEGDAGNIFLKVDELSVNGGSRISSSMEERFGTATGNAGNVTIQGLMGMGSKATQVELTQKSSLATTALEGKGGTIRVDAQGIVLNDSNVSATHVGQLVATTDPQKPFVPNAGGDIRLTADSIVAFDGAEISSETTGPGTAGVITLDVNTLETNVIDPSEPSLNHSPSRVSITSSSKGNISGDAGDITIQGIENIQTPQGEELSLAAKTITLVDTDVSTLAEGTGEGGRIFLNSDETNLMHSIVSADVANGIDAKGIDDGIPIFTGGIDITASALTIQGGGLTARTRGKRVAGQIDLNVEEFSAKAGTKDLRIGDVTTKRVQISTSSEDGAIGFAGAVGITGGKDVGPLLRIKLEDTDISTQANGTGEAGFITLEADESIGMTHSTLSSDVNEKGESSFFMRNISVSAPVITIQGGGITAQTTGGRAAGEILLHAGTLLKTQMGSKPVLVGDQMTSRVQISSSSGENASGSAGLVMIQGLGFDSQAKLISLNDTTVSSRAAGDSAAGSIIINASEQVALNRSELNTEVQRGNSGSILVSAGKSIDVLNTGFSVQASGGSGGNIELKSGNLVELRGETEISASNSEGPAGNVLISGLENSPSIEKVKLDNKGRPVKNDFGQTVTESVKLVNTIRLEDTTVNTNSQGDTGGNIELNADFLIHLVDSKLKSDIVSGKDGGRVDLDPQFIVLQGQGTEITTAASGDTGNGGAIFLGRPGESLLIDGNINTDRALNASSQAGQGGTVVVGATTQSLSEEVPRPDVAIVDPQSFLPVRCASQQGGTFSSIVKAGLDALPPEPGDFFPSPLVLEETVGPDSSSSQASISLEALPFGFSATQEGSDLTSQIALSSSLLGCSL